MGNRIWYKKTQQILFLNTQRDFSFLKWERKLNGLKYIHTYVCFCPQGRLTGRGITSWTLPGRRWSWTRRTRRTRPSNPSWRPSSSGTGTRPTAPPSDTLQTSNTSADLLTPELVCTCVELRFSWALDPGERWFWWAGSTELFLLLELLFPPTCCGGFTQTSLGFQAHKCERERKKGFYSEKSETCGVHFSQHH